MNLSALHAAVRRGVRGESQARGRRSGADDLAPLSTAERKAFTAWRGRRNSSRIDEALLGAVPAEDWMALPPISSQAAK